MKDIIRRQRLFFVSLIGIVVVSLALMSTFAYQTLGVDIKEGSSDKLSIKAGVLDVAFTTSRRINLSNMPLLDDYKTSEYTEFTVDNTKSSEDVLYNIKLTDLEFSENLITEDFKYTIVKVNDDNSTNIISNGDFSDLDVGEYVFANNYGNYIYIKKGEVQKIRIYLWIQETNNDQNHLENTSFKGLLEINSLFAKDVQDKVITEFTIYGNTKIDYSEGYNEVSIGYPANIKSLGELVTDQNDKNYGKYKIDLVANGKNLFKTEESFERENDSWVYQTIYLTKDIYNVNFISDDFNYIMIKDIDNNIVYKEQPYTESFEINNDGYYKVYIGDINNSYKFPVNSTPSQYQAQLVRSDNTNIDIYEPYIEPITYSLYLKEPLRCINETCDYIDFINNKLVRKVNELVLNGSEDWKIDSNSNYDKYYISSSINNKELISTHFKYSNKEEVGIFNITNNNARSDLSNLNIIYSNKNESNLDSFKNWLNNNNVKIYYLLNKDIEEVMPALNIKYFNSKTVIVTDGILSSKNIKIAYNE